VPRERFTVIVGGDNVGNQTLSRATPTICRPELFGTLQLRQLARQPCTDVPHFLLDVRCCSPQMFAGHILEVAH
jgi:hypothetical protein